MDNTCFRHTDVFAFNTCVSCTKSICASCSTQAPEGTFCSERCMQVYREMRGWVETRGEESEKRTSGPTPAAAVPRPMVEPHPVAGRPQNPAEACSRHPEVAKVGVCLRCQKNVCGSCLVEVSWGSFCSSECSVIYKGFEPQPDRSRGVAVKVGVFAVLCAAAVFAVVKFLGGPAVPAGGSGAGTDAEARRKADEEGRRGALAAEAESRRKAEEEARRRTEVESDRRRQADAGLAAFVAAESKRKGEEDAEARGREEEARLKTEETARLEAARKKAEMEAEAKRKAEEEEAKRKAEMELAAKKKAEEEARAKTAAEAEARRKADEETARVKAAMEAETKRKMEEETRRKAEEEARRKAAMEAETKRRAEEDARKKAEEDARKKADEDARKKVEEESALRLQKDLDEASRLISVATPLYKEVADGIDPLPEEEAALRTLLRKAQTAESNLAEAQMLYRKVETTASDPASVKRRVESLSSLIDTMRKAIRNINSRLQ